ncbi:MAG TPA: hypothetical protein VFX24_08585 [Ktedonobacterales bacterium]|nr:hypothetical protein [Ktedonobacterales bacterium]
MDNINDTGTAQDHSSAARLHGRWSAVLRVACLGLAIVSLIIWIWGLPLRYAQLGTICTVAAANCGDQQITPELFQMFTAAGVPIGFYAAYIGTIEVLYALAYLVMGGLIFWRKSETRIGLLTAVLLITYGVTQTDGTVVATSVPVLSIPANLLSALSFVLLALFLYLFPDGRFAPRWSRWVALIWIPLFLVVSTTLADAVVPILFGFIFLSIGAQIYRYRRVSTPIQRQQTKWVVFGLLFGLLGSGGIIIVGALLGPEHTFGPWGILVANALIYMFSACIPLSIGWAILRARLWEIDTLINKALVYGSLTGLLGLLYAGFVIGLGRLIELIPGQSASNPAILVISTLAIAALFQPLRARLQSTIDRRFYRRKYDVEKTLAAFSATLRNEVNLEQVRAQMLFVVNETMQPAHISLWLRLPESPSTGQARHPEADS